MRFKPLVLLFLTVFSSISAQISVETWCKGLCPEGQICGKGIGESENKANLNANNEISKGIASSISSVTNDILSSEEKDGLLTEFSKFVENTVVKSSFENMEAAKQHRSYKENGTFVSEKYICKAAAAKPYLRKLEHLKDSLNLFAKKINKETCMSTVEIYKQIRVWEGILENLGQTNKAMQKEYNSFYEKMKKDCGQVGNGVFLTKNASKNPIAGKVEEILRQKVSISEGTCMGGAMVAIEGDDKPLCSEGMIGITCKANVSLVITQCKDGKKSEIKGYIIGSDKYSEDTATKQAMRKIDKADFWDKWMKELEKWSKQ